MLGSTPYDRAVSILLVAAGVLLLLGDTLHLASKGFAWTVVLALAFTAFAAGLLLLPGALTGSPGWLLLAGATVAFIGSVAGVSMQTLFRVREVLDQSTQPQALDILGRHSGIRFTTLVPGILFPLGLLLISIDLLRREGIALACTLALGAILFPVGHAIGLAPALIGGDIVLLAAFFQVALRLNHRGGSIGAKGRTS